MSDIIHLLPDSIANQIAAGEVIQRPASVVKELVENSLDAGASHIQILIKDAGRTLVQVIDNGKGMSLTDVRMAFERHATSKIKSADDLFSLTTMGFRGEALPSIAAVAQVEVKTRRPEDEVGSFLSIAGSEVEKQEAVSCAEGTSISVKNIFFNVPARRKFLKSNETERRNIFAEIERIVLVHPDVEFTLIENDVQTLRLPAATLRQRISQMVGKNINPQLIEINADTSLAKMHGYISKPEFARKTKGNQFFFVNGRYIRHPYFHKAVTTAFAPLIPADENPVYFIYLEVDPASIDVNIHPTKTEVKFENEPALWQILLVTVKESLGKFNEIPSIDFDREDAPDIPIFDPAKSVSMPKVNTNPDYNPFLTASGGGNKYHKQLPNFNWEELYHGFENYRDEPSGSQGEEKPADLFDQKTGENGFPAEISPEHYQFKQRYILTSVKSGLMIIDQHRAHVRILFDKYIDQIKNRRGISQRVLFPEMLDLSAAEASALPAIIDDLEALGFELSNLGNNTFAIQGIPSEIENPQSATLIRSMIDKSIETESNLKDDMRESIALSLANQTAMPYGRTLSLDEMLLIVNQLFATSTPNFTPDGRTVIAVISDEELGKKMK
ncbi:MAG: DNA mismatch repair endonuclease MutL [Dysgonamonadaceae bacterium]|jgi:DNA mismatch repair protein MutL|nr:DNA mismatch repair endonuclease MutL [Dysgonamonadaceae bacterium]